MGVPYDAILTKDVRATLDYTFDWSDWLPPADEIVNVEWEATAGLDILQTAKTQNSTTIFIAGGKAGTAYVVACTIWTKGGRIERRAIQIGVFERTGLVKWEGSPSTRGQVAFAASGQLRARARGLSQVRFSGVGTLSARGQIINTAAVRFVGTSTLAIREPSRVSFGNAGILIVRGSIGGAPPDEEPWMGVAIDEEGSTVFAPGVVFNAANSSELANGLRALVAGTADQVWLVPGQAYSWTKWIVSSSGNPLNRTKDNPGVVMTDPTIPGAPQAEITDILEDGTGAWSGLALVNLRLQSARFLMYGGGSDLLIEGCNVWADLQAGRIGAGDFDLTKSFYNCCLRKNFILDHYAISASNLTHGVYCVNCELKMELNVVDHNGWIPGGTRATDRDAGGPTTHKHDIYLNKPSPPCLIRHNVIGTSSSHGMHIRPGGEVYENLWLYNAITSQFGYGNDGKAQWGNSSGYYSRNVIIEADDINTSSGDFRANGCWLSCVDGVTFEDNIWVNERSVSGNYPGNRAVIWIDGGYPLLNILIRNNISYNFGGPTRGIHNPQGRDISGITQINNHWDDGTVYANPDVVDNYKHSVIMPYFRSNGVSKSELLAIFDDIRAGFAIVSAATGQMPSDMIAP